MTVRTLLSFFEDSSYATIEISEVIGGFWYSTTVSADSWATDIPSYVLDCKVLAFGVPTDRTLSIRIGE